MLNDLETLLKSATSPAKIQAYISEHIENAQKDISQWDSTKVRIAIAGESGRGKSSLINAIAGEAIAPVGVTETTQERKEYSTKHGLTLEDLPGCNTQNFKFETYVEQMNLSECDAIILVISGRVTDNDVKLYELLTNSLNKTCFVVRTKIDTDVENARYDNNKSEADTLTEIRNDLFANFKSNRPARVYLVSNRHATKYDLADLIEDIKKSLGGLKQAKFIASSAAYTKSAILAKRETITNLADKYAWASAANGINPVIGLNIAVDVGILLKLATDVLEFYGLTEQQMSKIHGDANVTATIQVVGRFAAEYLTKAGITQILKGLAGREAFKSLIKFVPFVGQAVAAGLGYFITKQFASSLIDDCEKKALELLDAVMKQGL